MRHFDIEGSSVRHRKMRHFDIEDSSVRHRKMRHFDIEGSSVRHRKMLRLSVYLNSFFPRFCCLQMLDTNHKTRQESATALNSARMHLNDREILPIITF